MKKNNLKVDALVVGAGPVGMTLSSILHHNGLKVLLIDKRKERLSTPRGIAINQATLDIFQLLKIDNIFLNGLEIDHIDLYWKTKKLGEFNFKNSSLQRPWFFHIMQNQIENYLETHLEDKGLQIQKDFEFLNYSQKNKRVYSELEFENEIIQINSGFLIGCDGGNSQVRQAMCAGINQKYYGSCFLLADVLFQNQQFENTQYVFTPVGYLMIVPLPENKYRLIFSIKDDSLTGKSENEIFSLAFIEQLLQQRTPGGLRISKIIWATRAKYGHKISEKIYQGNVVLAGDALHQFSPVGGTNMNIGIQDAWTLAWRIIHIHRGSPSLLGEYAKERKIMMKNQQYLTEWITALITRSKKYPALNKSLNLHNLQRQLSGFHYEKKQKHLQYFIDFKEHRPVIQKVHEHFFNACFVLLTMGEISTNHEQAIQNFLAKNPHVKWVHNNHNLKQFYYCRPDAVVIHRGNLQDLDHLLHSKNKKENTLCIY